MVLGVLSSPTISRAEEPTGTAPPRVAGPSPHDGAIATEPSQKPVVAPAAPPLTRAAVRARIQSMDPAPWLARFGQVERSATGHH